MFYVHKHTCTRTHTPHTHHTHDTNMVAELHTHIHTHTHTDTHNLGVALPSLTEELSVAHLENVQRYLRARIQHHPQRKEPYLLHPFFFLIFFSTIPRVKCPVSSTFFLLFFFKFYSEHHPQGKQRSPISSTLN